MGQTETTRPGRTIDDVYGPQSYNAKTLGKKPIAAQIVGVAFATMPASHGERGKDKVVLSLKGHEKTVILNKTNAKRLARDWGGDPMAWIGHEVKVEVVPIIAFGEEVYGIQVSAVK